MGQGSLPVEAAASGGGFLETGALASLDNAVDKTTGTIKLKAVFNNEKLLLWPGQFVRVTLNLDSREGVVLVPSRAVQAGSKGPYVYVVSAQNTAEMRPVTSGAILDGFTIIEEGLQGGESVITDGQIRLVPGAAVQVTMAKTPAPAPAKAPETPAPAAASPEPAKASETPAASPEPSQPAEAPKAPEAGGKAP